MAENFDPNLPPAPQRPAVDPYGFIMNPQQQKPKRSLGMNPGDSLLKKVAILAGGGVVILIALIVAMNVFLGSSSNTEQMLSVVERQQEVVRLAGMGKSVNSLDVRNFAANTLVTVGNQQSSLLALMAKDGQKVDTKKLTIKKNAQSDQLLEGAKSTNTFDTTYVQIMQSELTQYQNDLRTAFKTSTGKQTKADLQAAFDSSVLLLQQLKDASE